MATQYKKIQNKIHPKEQESVKEDLKPKASRDALLLVLIAVTALVLVLGWNTMDDIGHAMYAALVVGMGTVYINRRMTLSENVHKILNRHQLHAAGGFHRPFGLQHVCTVHQVNSCNKKAGDAGLFASSAFFIA